MTHTPAPTQSSKSIWQQKSFLIPLLGIVLIIVAALVWLYTGQVSAAKRSVFRSLPLPVAIIEAKIVTSTNLYERVELASELLAQSGAEPTNLESEILDQLIETKKVETIARQKDVRVTPEDLDNAFAGILRQFPNQSEAELAKVLEESYGLSLATFKNEVLQQTVYEEKLALWFNSQESLNPEAYSSARELLSQLDNGSDFTEVAMKFSEDPASQAFAGDSGFVPYSDLLPEFQTAVKDLALQDNIIVASRYGIHILKLNAIEDVGSGDNLEKSYNLQQIFIAPNDFSRWLSSETSNIKSWKLL